MPAPVPEPVRRPVVGAGIVDALGAPTRLLAARRSAPAALAGRWELPGGKVEPEERPESALRRELREELGIEVDLGQAIPGPLPGGGWPLPPVGVAPPGADTLAAAPPSGRELLVWLVQVRGDGIPAPLADHDALTWLTPDRLYAVPWLPADLAPVRAIAARLWGEFFEGPPS